MALAIISVILISFAITFTGCAQSEKNIPTPSKDKDPVNHITTVIYDKARDPNIKDVSHFAAGQMPALKIQSHVGGEGFFMVVNSSSGDMVKAEKIDLSKDQIVYWPLLNLAPGSYIASIKMPGSVESDSWYFTVGSKK